jgi:hypothetical protein
MDPQTCRNRIIGDSKRYLKRLGNYDFSDLISKFHQALKNDQLLFFLKTFALCQDNKYAKQFQQEQLRDVADVKISTLFDDFCEVYLFANCSQYYSRSITDANTKMHVLAHDAWAIAKLHVVSESGKVVAFVPTKGMRGDFFDVNIKGTTYYFDKLRTLDKLQFVDYGKLSAKELNKDTVPADTWREMKPLWESLNS